MMLLCGNGQEGGGRGGGNINRREVAHRFSKKCLKIFLPQLKTFVLQKVVDIDNIRNFQPKLSKMSSVI